MSKTDNKLTVLQLIREKKEILFGAFSDKMSKQKKNDEWKNVLKKCQSLGLVPAGKDYAYVRDTFYSNLKRATLNKRDNARRTGTGGGKNSIFTPIDEIIMEIIGKDSPITDGILEQPTTSVPIVEENSDIEIPDLSLNPTIQSSSNGLNVNEKRNDIIVQKGSKRYNIVIEEETKKKRKLDLQLEFLELKNYKLKLEILEMERKLNVESLEHTKNIKQNLNPQENIQDNSNKIIFFANDHLIINDDGTHTVVTGDID